MMGLRRSVLLFLAVVGLWGGSAAAQTSVHGALRERVADSQGLAVHQANIVVESTDSGGELRGETSEDGACYFPRLRPCRPTQ